MHCFHKFQFTFTVAFTFPGCLGDVSITAGSMKARHSQGPVYDWRRPNLHSLRGDFDTVMRQFKGWKKIEKT